MDRYLGKLLGGRYEVLSVLGVGGMAVVYRARCQVLNRFVAVKVLKDEFAGDEEFRRRFYNESLAVAQLSHANIVSVYDVVQNDDVQYIVMELIDGITLKEYMSQKGALSWQETLFFAEQIAKALEHAHERGIIHQDIKPHNIILLRDGTAKVTDFGIARFEHAQETRVIAQAIGSVHYISPEQARGSSIDQRTDLYALGIVMYEMLTGEVPFDGDTVVGIVMQHLNAVPKLPSERIPAIPRGMDDIVMHAMSPVLNHRYAKARVIYDDLEQLKFDPSRRFNTISNAGVGNDETVVMPQAEDAARAAAMRTAQRKPTTKTGSKISFSETGEIGAPPQRRNAGGAGQPRRGKPRKRSFLQWLGESPFVLIIIAAVIFAAITIGVFISMFNKIGDVSAFVDVPQLVGLQIDMVLADADIQANFAIVQTGTEADPSAEDGEILWQSIDSGDRTLVGSTIDVIVCLNDGVIEEVEDEPEETVIVYEMPDFVDTNAEDAAAELVNNGFFEYELVQESSLDIAEGNVTRTTPKAGADLYADDNIIIYVSTGTTGMMVAVPDLIDSTVTEAAEKLEQMYLVIGSTIMVDSDLPAGTVIEQSVEAGVEVKVGSTIDVRISAGTEGEVLDEGEEEPLDEGNNQNESTELGYARFTIPFPDATVATHLEVWIAGELKHTYDYAVGTAHASVELMAPIGAQEVTVCVNDIEWVQTEVFT